jgi:hypothetical protein
LVPRKSCPLIQRLSATVATFHERLRCSVPDAKTFTRIRRQLMQMPLGFKLYETSFGAVTD